MQNCIPKQYTRTATTIRLESAKLDLIDKTALKYNISRNEFLNQCIDFALLHMRDISHQEYFAPRR